MKKAYLVTFSLTTRVIADSHEQAEDLAVAKARSTCTVDVCLENHQSTVEDDQCPVSREDIEEQLYPGLQSLTEDQQEHVQKVWDEIIYAGGRGSRMSDIANGRDGITDDAWPSLLDKATLRDINQLATAADEFSMAFRLKPVRK